MNVFLFCFQLLTSYITVFLLLGWRVPSLNKRIAYLRRRWLQTAVFLSSAVLLSSRMCAGLPVPVKQ